MKYNKFWIALLGAVITALVDQYQDVAWVQALIPALTAVGVYLAPNRK